MARTASGAFYDEKRFAFGISTPVWLSGLLIAAENDAWLGRFQPLRAGRTPFITGRSAALFSPGSVVTAAPSVQAVHWIRAGSGTRGGGGAALVDPPAE
jgi:hypothetical protein